RQDTDAGRADVAVGDVNLAAVLGAHRVPVEFKIAVVDVQHARALAHNRLAAALDHGAGDAGIAQPCAAARRSRARGGGLDAVAGTGLHDGRRRARGRLDAVTRAGFEQAATGR